MIVKESLSATLGIYCMSSVLSLEKRIKSKQGEKVFNAKICKEMVKTRTNRIYKCMVGGKSNGTSYAS